MWDAFVLAFAVTAAVGDLLWRRIPSKFTAGGLIAGLIYHYLYGGLGAAVAAAGLGFGIGLALYQLRAVGGGDVKLITALGAMLGWDGWLLAMKIALVIAGVLAVFEIARRRMVKQTLRNIGVLINHLMSQGLKPHPEINVKNPALVRVPFGVAAAMGMVYTVFTQP